MYQEIVSHWSDFKTRCRRAYLNLTCCIVNLQFGCGGTCLPFFVIYAGVHRTSKPIAVELMSVRKPQLNRNVLGDVNRSSLVRLAVRQLVNVDFCWILFLQRGLMSFLYVPLLQILGFMLQ